jgi:hypothetical protein
MLRFRWRYNRILLGPEYTATLTSGMCLFSNSVMLPAMIVCVSPVLCMGWTQSENRAICSVEEKRYG